MLHTCTPYCRHDPATPRRGRAGHTPLTIDFHCHVLTPEVEPLVADHPAKRAEPELLLRMQGEAAYQQNEKVYGDANRRLSSIGERLADMDRMGVDVQVISPSGVQYYYWAEEGLAELIVRMQNENVADLCARHPGRLRGLGTVALQHPKLAVEQLRHCVRELGLQGVVVSSLIHQKELADPAFEPFWKEASDLGCIVFLHPLGSSLGERLATANLSNIIGQPIETTIALSKLIFSGSLDRHPGVKLVAAHGGGYLASYFGRSEHGHHVRPEAHEMERSPLDYLKRMWFDSVVYDPRIVRHLIEVVGASRILLGTDYPYDMGTYDVHDFADAVPGITDEEKRLLLGGNAATLLGLNAATAVAAARRSMA